MSKSRKKETVIPVTREQMETALAEYRAARLEEKAAYLWHERAMQKLDNKLGEKLPPIEQRVEAAFATLKAWATQNPEEFAKARSIAKPSGTLGYKLGNWTVKPAKGWTLESVLNFMLGRPTLCGAYVRFVPELNRQALLAKRLTLSRRPKYLEKIGIRFQQDDTFFVDANLTTNETATKESV